MNLYTTLTLRYLKKNKKRTIVTIIGVILSTALICSIGSIYESYMDYQFRQTIEQEGHFHSAFYNVKKEDLDTITKSAGIDKSSISEDLGYSKLNKDKLNLINLKAYDKNGFEMNQVKLKEGRLPTNENEIVLSERAIPSTNKKVGDTITLNVGKRVDEYGKGIEIPILKENETLADTKEKEYKIVGIMKKPYAELSEISNGITYLEPNKPFEKDTLDVYILFNNPKEAYKIGTNIAKTLGLEVEKSTDNDESMIYNNDNKTYYENLYFNEYLLRLQGASLYENINETFNKILLTVTLLVIACTVVTVYNSFSISVSERKKQFGVLNSIGATKAQVMKLVFIEAIVISLIGIPIGLLLGTFGMDLIFKSIQIVFNSQFISDINLRVIYNPYIILGSVLIVLLAILVSSILPAINCAKTSPLEAIRNSDNLKIGKVKNSKLVKLIFKTEGVLAYKNLRRNKKKFRITLFSLVISVVIFISFSGFIDLFEKANEVNIGDINYDMRVWYSGIREKNDIVKDLNNIKGVNKISAINPYGAETYVNENNINKEHKELIERRFLKENKNGEVVYTFDNNGINFLGDKAIKELELKTGSFDKESAIKENGIILRNKSDNSSSRKQSEISLTNYKVGDTINICKRYIDKNDNEVREPIKLKVLATTEDFISGYRWSTYMGIDFITYNEVGEKLGYKISDGDIYIDTDKTKETREAVKDIAKKYGYDVSDDVEDVLEMEEAINVMKIFVYGFTVAISLISATNIINTMSTNINLRKKEFAIIKSIGVTPSGFSKMIYLESLLYGVFALLYGLPIGLLIDVYMNKVLGNVIEIGMVLPIKAVLMSIVGIFVITFVSAYIPMKKINKENVIENIRQESI